MEFKTIYIYPRGSTQQVKGTFVAKNIVFFSQVQI